MEMEVASAYLPDDVVVEIVAQLPAKSLCRFKSVSRKWRHLISDHCHRVAQTLSGLFYHRGARPAGFATLRAPPPPGVVVDSALSLPPSCDNMEMELLDCCNGLLLLRSRARFYMVCNPATGDCVTLPPPRYTPGETSHDEENTSVAAIGFYPAASPHFYVFQLVEESQYIHFAVAVEMYSLETGKWILRESAWSKEESIACNLQMTYVNGFLHFALIYDAVASVDTKGETWRDTRVRQRDEEDDDRGFGFVGHSQGRLLYVDVRPNDDSISIFVHEDHDSCWEWTFKHSVSKLDLIPPRMSPRKMIHFDVAALHPHGDLIYFYDWTRRTLISYDMTPGAVHVICTLGEVFNAHRPFLPYVPFYSGPLASSSAD